MVSGGFIILSTNGTTPNDEFEFHLKLEIFGKHATEETPS
jgi:hypothetical protein